MAKKKPLPKEINGVRIVSDCGISKLNANSRTLTRNAIVECPDCKKHRKINVYALKSGKGLCPSCSTKGERNGAYKHGMNTSRTATIHMGMKQRCENKNVHDYASYGGRGIRVCEEWQTVAGFVKWADGRLEDPKMSVERIDFDGDYTPENCTVLPTHLQAYNRRNGIDFKTAVAFAKELSKFDDFRPPRGYIMKYMQMFDLKDFQVQHFVTQSKHKEELANYEVVS